MILIPIWTNKRSENQKSINLICCTLNIWPSKSLCQERDYAHPITTCYTPAFQTLLRPCYIPSLTLQEFSSLSPLAPLGIKGCVSYLVAKLSINRYLSLLSCQLFNSTVYPPTYFPIRRGVHSTKIVLVLSTPPKNQYVTRIAFLRG